MNPDNKLKPLEEQLTQLSWWSEPAPELWNRAMSQADKPAEKSRRYVHRFLQSRWPWIGTPIAAVIVVALFMHNRMNSTVQSRFWALVGDQPKSFISPSSPPETTSDGDGDSETSFGVNASEGQRWNDASYGYQVPYKVKGASSLTVATGVNLPVLSRFGVATSPPSAEVPAPPGRQVIHRAAIDLKTDDVRGIYLKIQTLVPSEAQGEYVEQSQIQGSDKSLEGYITLRVQGDRLGQVMNMLRGLAEVVREQNDASDVTPQVVDVEARLRNERRIEQELLALLDKRTDAPLQDVLKVRESLGSVRERIEQLTGQQATLAKQVALATVLVTIRQKDAPPAPTPAPTGFAQQFAKKLGAAWSGGLDLLGSSLAALVQVVLGGLIFWIGLIIAVVLLRRWYMRRTESTDPPRQK